MQTLKPLTGCGNGWQTLRANLLWLTLQLGRYQSRQLNVQLKRPADLAVKGTSLQAVQAVLQHQMRVLVLWSWILPRQVRCFLVGGQTLLATFGQRLLISSIPRKRRQRRVSIFGGMETAKC